MMHLDLHDQVSATRSVTHAAAQRAHKTARGAADAAHAIDLHEPAHAAKAIAGRTAKKAAKGAAKATGRAAERRTRRAGRRGVRVVVIAVIAGGLLALGFAVFRRVRATPSGTPTIAGSDGSDTDDHRDAAPEARSETRTNGTSPVTAASTAPTND
jgi:hypothetical protein